ncbi:anthranilate synthase component I family protein [Myxococcota bacterium]|nr:anthranilate synthase component I family protein [Myxococcota bacterium]
MTSASAPAARPAPPQRAVLDAAGLVVHHVRGPAPCPSTLLAHATDDDHPFVFVSGPGDPALTGWSYGALEPAGRAASIADAARAIAAWLDGARSADPALPPFTGGAVGFTGYDLGWSVQLRPRAPRPTPLGLPHASFALFDAIYARSTATGEGVVIAQPTAAAEARAMRLVAALSSPERATALRGALDGALSTGVTQVVHEARIAEALELIRAGEIYQVNLTYPLVGRYGGRPEAAFLRLLGAPPPFAAFLRVERDQAIVSASPECFFDLDAATRRIAVYPIKGTRARAARPDEDEALKAALLSDAKERAEHLMIVDLLRNDVGRIAEIGSVHVDGLAYVESFPTVHHLTSRIVARVPERVDLERVMRALFPGGSITGVPKLRAMEVIDALEGRARGIYTGAIAYVTPSGSARASIAIRTAEVAGGEVRFGVGGGIVADSVPSREWEETVLKARALTAALAG